MENRLVFITQGRYSRSQLILRLLFMPVILIPHNVLLFFVGIYNTVYQFLVFVKLLFVGTISKIYVERIINTAMWTLRVQASLYDMIDGYPSFGLDYTHPHLKEKYPKEIHISRVSGLVRRFFAPILLLPHIVILTLMSIVLPFTVFMANVSVLFTAHYPLSLYNFHARILQLQTEMVLFSSLALEQYPPIISEALVIEDSAQEAPKVEATQKTLS